ncbi:hypothetical protein CO173_04490 [Candidatus Uhrbacteria bacterium CG_4_9_14_3_um_filter_41_35]|uniref:Uncharacterized protein n=1 Tax=Candidatus Uhrbacteria bacterium CG_4_9_14_3_um_filter_41_35 TaxID=1975034 RepID=A0A2M7XD36_9BACT|nr:MAG: hypothetical protein COV92_04070 [Candidatus Uhrbacteria bacterium CG11_big_fil_rev_8_21_14_0_20_41_9]PJA45801.1 MAG: hypothetical protein CO173_04490 [Candidatus Uhrbacteria bacterium CG_4_9_14_3_um_filter_41_35]
MINNSKQSNDFPSFADKILERLETEKVTPNAKWKYSGKNVLFWLIWVFSVQIGAIAFASSLFTLFNAGWQYYSATHDSFFRFFIESMPYMWLLVLCIFLYIGLENIRHTTKGYRYSIPFILFCSVIGSLIFGVFLYVFGLGQLFDEVIGNRVPFHDTVVEHQEAIWLHPENGLLAGAFNEFNSELEPASAYNFVALDGKNWQIDTSDLRAQDFENIAEFSRVRIIGVAEADGGTKLFHACFVMPWGLKMSEVNVKRAKPLVLEHIEDCVTSGCEINSDEMRSSKCKDLRPYSSLQKMRNY